MKKFFSFFVVVALVIGFSACEREDAPEAVEVEDIFDASLKGFTKLDGDDGKDLIVFKWNAITASEFAKGKTPPFNNWAKAVDAGVYLFRSNGKTMPSAEAIKSEDKKALGNGNDPAYIWFDLAEITKAAESWKALLTSELTVLVRYKSSNNVAITFNVFAAATWCKLFGPISLQCETLGRTNLGDVTQIRIEDLKEPLPPGEVKVIVIMPDGEEKEIFGKEEEEGCPIVYLTDIEKYFEGVNLNEYFGLADNQKVVGWEAVEGEFGKAKCGEFKVKPIIETTNCISVTDPLGETFPLCEIDACPVLTWEKFATEFDIPAYEAALAEEDKILVGFYINGKLFGEGDEVESCDDITVVAKTADFCGWKVANAKGDCISGLASFTADIYGVDFTLLKKYCNEDGEYERVAGQHSVGIGGKKKDNMQLLTTTTTWRVVKDNKVIINKTGTFTDVQLRDAFDGCGNWEADDVYFENLNLTFSVEVKGNDLEKFEIVKVGK
jgi:hypothetical protein